MASRTIERQESGVVLVTVVLIMLPLLALAGGVSSLMTGRNSRMLEEIRDRRAFLAAESGVAEGVYRAQNGTLTSGTTFNTDLGTGSSLQVFPELLSADGIDNDEDSLIDELDEQVFRLTVAGFHGGAVKRLAAIVAPRPVIPELDGAITVLDDAEVDLDGNARASGWNTNIDGTRGDTADDVYGIVITPPRTVTDLNAALDLGGTPVIEGLGGDPSIGVAAATIDLAALLQLAQNTADVVLAPGNYDSVSYGDASLSDFRTVYCSGNLDFTSSVTGAGLLVVDGDFDMRTGCRWDGLVVVTRYVRLWNDSLVNGAVVRGENYQALNNSDDSVVRYSQEALDQVDAVTTRYDVREWREISRN